MRVTKPHSRRIEILSQLKVTWNTRPVDMKLIQSLQTKLNNLKSPQLQKKVRTPIHGIPNS